LERVGLDRIVDLAKGTFNQLIIGAVEMVFRSDHQEGGFVG